jgi:hypothetical protein
MASSTTRPSDIIKANRDIIFSETSNLGKSQKAPKKDIGMPIVVQKARRMFRNRVRQTKTRISPR